MADFRLTVIDESKRRTTHYGGYSGPLLIASRNPTSIEGFAREHDDSIAQYVGSLYSDQRVSDEELRNPNRDKLLHTLSTCETPIWVLDKKSLDELVSIARQPDYKDYGPNQKAGTSIKPTRDGISYDGVVVIDLRTREIGIKGTREMYLGSGKLVDGIPEFDDRIPEGKRGEPHYRWFGFLSDLREGHACFEGGNRINYKLSPEWTIKDLRTGNNF